MENFLSPLVADIISIFGGALLIIAYFMLQGGKMLSESLIYNILNFIGSALIIVSLLVKFNMAAFLVEVCWALIAFWGIFRAFRNKNPN